MENKKEWRPPTIKDLDHSLAETGAGGGPEGAHSEGAVVHNSISFSDLVGGSGVQGMS